MDKLLNLLGLARKAGKLEIGEEPAGAAARAHDARLIVVASDAAENTIRRVRHFAEAGQCLWVQLPESKAQLGQVLGRSSCAMAAVTDVGLALAAAEKLAEKDDRFEETVEKLRIKADRAAERRREALQHEKNVRSGKKKRTESPPESPPEHRSGKKPAGTVPAGRKSEARHHAAETPYHPNRSSKERQQRRREGMKRTARARFIYSRPVKKGKGSNKDQK